MHKFFRKTSGFSLIELMLVIVILGLLTAVAMPAYSEYTLRSKYAEGYTGLAALQKAEISYYLENKMFLPIQMGNCPSGGSKLALEVDPGTDESWDLLKRPLVSGPFSFFSYATYAGGTDETSAPFTITIGTPTRTSGDYDGQNTTIVRSSAGGNCQYLWDYEGMGIGQTPNEDWVAIFAIGDFDVASPTVCSTSFITVRAINGEVSSNPIVNLNLGQ